MGGWDSMQLAHKMMFLESSLYTAALVVGALLVGLWAGGFAYTAALRRSEGRRAIGEPSYCPKCGERLSFGETIPLFGWLMRKGLCSHCGNPISIAYPTSELLGAGVFASIVLRHGVTLQTLELFALVVLLMVIAVSSLLDYHIPNKCIWLAVLIRFVYLFLYQLQGGTEPLVSASIVGALALGIPLFISVWLSNAVLARDVVGMGTVKLVAVVGLYLGWQQGLICLAGAAVLGSMVFLVSPKKKLPVEVEGGALEHDGNSLESLPSPRRLRPTFEEDIAEPIRAIPFAPSIVIALWVMLLVGVTPAVWNSPML